MKQSTLPCCLSQLALFVFWSAAITESDAQGILYTVNTTNDTIVIGACENGNAGCSLRGAIQTANTHPGADGIDINLPAGAIINLTNALPDITESVSITGAGANKLTVRRDTGGNYPIFTINTTGPAALAGMTITNGGGGIVVNHGPVTVRNMAIVGNTGGNFGGGIVNLGELTVTNTLIAGNSATLGGGIENDGSLTVVNSTISDNTAQLGGGLYCGEGTVVLTNSTICRNDAESFGGGVVTQDSHPMTKGTIIASNTSDSNPDVFGDFSSLGFNLIGVNQAGGFTQPTDQTGTIAQPLDPKLDPNGLQHNGGPTQTIALRPESPAVDKGTSNGANGNLTTDQRGNGFLRKFDYPFIANAAGGNGADIGAVELLAPYTASRKMHGNTPFDIQNPLAGLAAIECRSGGSTGDFEIIVTFAAPVAVNGSPQAQVTTGTGTVGAGGVANGGIVTINGADVTVPLTNVVNAQTLVVTLFAVDDGTSQHDINVPMSFLVGDSNGDGSVNSADISQTKSKSGQPVDAINFRNDVNADGSINSADISLVKSKSGTGFVAEEFTGQTGR